MKIRRYLGNDTQEAILKVKMDLGNDAVILNTRKVRQKGLFKIFAKPMVEVLAALDEDYSNKRNAKSNKNEEKDLNTAKPAPLQKEVQLPENPGNRLSELESKVGNMENLLQKIYLQIQSGDQKVAGSYPQERKSNFSNLLQEFSNKLLKNEVEPEIVKNIINNVKAKLTQNPGTQDCISLLYNTVLRMLGDSETIKLRNDGKPTVIIFVGPTGVGKTTTLAKIAANYALTSKKNVGLITADTYRISAVDQLKTYAEILGIPVSVVYTAEEINSAISSYSDKDLVLIDTAGRSFKNKTQNEELKALVEASGADEVFLVLSSTTSTGNCSEILKNYMFLKRYKLIFTKMDEAPISGIILNVRHLTGMKLSYITTGQSVPDDIEVVNTDVITKNLLGSFE